MRRLTLLDYHEAERGTVARVVWAAWLRPVRRKRYSPPARLPTFTIKPRPRASFVKRRIWILHVAPGKVRPRVRPPERHLHPVFPPRRRYASNFSPLSEAKVGYFGTASKAESQLLRDFAINRCQSKLPRICRAAYRLILEAALKMRDRDFCES